MVRGLASTLSDSEIRQRFVAESTNYPPSGPPIGEVSLKADEISPKVDKVQSESFTK